jgi:hypothetical protein
MDLRDSLVIGLLGATGLCILELPSAVSRALEPVDDKAVAVASEALAGTPSGRWVELRGRASDAVGTVVTIGGDGTDDGRLVFRLAEDPGWWCAATAPRVRIQAFPIRSSADLSSGPTIREPSDSRNVGRVYAPTRLASPRPWQPTSWTATSR